MMAERLLAAGEQRSPFPLRGRMSGRRSHARFIVSPSSHGAIRVFADAEVEGIGHKQISLITHDPATTHERMLLELPGDDGDFVLPVQVTESRPIIVGSSVKHSVRLRLIDMALAHDDGGSSAAQIEERLRVALSGAIDRRVAIVVRELPVRLVNCSRSGCLVEAERALPVGTAGTMTLEIEGHDVTDHILVVRCQPIAGAGTLHHIGARLLWVAAPTTQTIRHALSPAENPV